MLFGVCVPPPAAEQGLRRGGDAVSELVMSIVRDRSFGDTGLKHVLGRLAWEAYDVGSHIVVSLETLADDWDLSRKTIQRVLRKLGRLDVLRLEERESGRRSRVYRLDVSYLATAFPLIPKVLNIDS